MEKKQPALLTLLMLLCMTLLVCLSLGVRFLRGGGGGGTLIFSHIDRLGPFFWVQNTFWGFQKN